MIKRCLITGLTTLLAIAPACAQSAGGPFLPESQPAISNTIPAQTLADAQRVAAYTLPESFFTNAADTLTALQAANIQPPNTQGASLDEVINRTAQVPHLPETLTSHGFTPESFVLGMSAFNMTLAARSHHLPPGIPQPTVQNSLSLQAHPTQTNAILQALNGPTH
ncbi:hypothetical protein [Neokomagataea thailandica]|nr:MULTISPECIES: hypothetical protein [Neokomagataea]